MKPRKALSKSLRFEVLKRDAFTCQYCGAKAPDVLLHVDHVLPVAKGGTNNILNLLAACSACNGGKSDRKLSDQSAIERQRKQLEELQERREQLDAMFKWQRGIADLKTAAVDQLAKFWCDLTPGWGVNDTGKQALRKLLGKFTVAELCEAMRVSAEQYLSPDPQRPARCSEDSWNVAFGKIGGVATIRKRCEDKPHMKALYWIRARAAKKFGWQQNEVLYLLENAFLGGWSKLELEQMVEASHTWSSFLWKLREAVKNAEGQ